MAYGKQPKYRTGSEIERPMAKAKIGKAKTVKKGKK